MSRTVRRQLMVLVGTLVLVAGGVPMTSATPLVPGPVSPAEAQRITEQLARHAPPLPRAIKGHLDAQNVAMPRAVEEWAADRITRLAASGWNHDLIARLVAADRARGGAAAAEESRNGQGCYSQGFGGSDGALMRPNEIDLNTNGAIDPWESDPNRGETCIEIGFMYRPAQPDRGSFTLELRTEPDPARGVTYQRIAGRWNYDSTGHVHGACNATPEEWQTANTLVADYAATLSKYDNNPMLAVRDGFLPYPIPLTKMFHWFNLSRWEDGQVLDPDTPEVFVATLTDDGWRPINVSPIYVFPGPDPVVYNPNEDLPAGNNAGSGCLVQWHAHTGAVEGTVTGNFDNRTWMGHLWFYGAVYPFGDHDLDGSEAHGWYAPLNNVVAACNVDGTCV